jgi:hypothetical protein
MQQAPVSAYNFITTRGKVGTSSNRETGALTQVRNGIKEAVSTDT